VLRLIDLLIVSLLLQAALLFGDRLELRTSKR
jgi:hypothetical protein